MSYPNHCLDCLSPVLPTNCHMVPSSSYVNTQARLMDQRELWLVVEFSHPGLGNMLCV